VGHSPDTIKLFFFSQRKKGEWEIPKLGFGLRPSKMIYFGRNQSTKVTKPEIRKSENLLLSFLVFPSTSPRRAARSLILQFSFSSAPELRPAAPSSSSRKAQLETGPARRSLSQSLLSARCSLPTADISALRLSPSLCPSLSSLFRGSADVASSTAKSAGMLIIDFHF
jgi:hypothetical protein